MSWPLFAAIQLALTAAGTAVVLWLRGRRLGALLEDRERLVEEAGALIEQAEARFSALATGAVDKWLAERTEALDEEDPVQLITKRVLQNEKEPIPDFEDTLRRQLDGDATDQGQEAWRRARTAGYQTACDLVERFPASHPVIARLYASFDELDAQYGVELPPLPEPPEPAADDGDGPEAMEHLRAANELLRQQLESAQKEIAALESSSTGAGQEDEDLKSLLKQFTRDSRDMMACIQELEQENQKLREQLGVTGERNTAGDQAHHAA